MQAIILSVGDELVLGQTVDTNSAWISQQLAAVGCDIAAHLTVPDDQRGIEQAMLESVGRCDVLIVSGGIGPTEDDLTRQALAAVMNVPLEPNEAWLAELDKFFAARGRTMPPINRIQAMIPRGAKMIFNHAGTAAGIEAELPHTPKGARKGASASKEDLDQMFGKDRAVQGASLDKLREFVDKDLADRRQALEEEKRRSAGQPVKTRVFVMPGVPKEMKAMFTRDVLPHVAERSNGGIILQRTLHTYGIGESAVAERLGDLMRRGRNPSVGTTVSEGQVSLRVNSRFGSLDEARRQLEETSVACVAALGDLIYGQDLDDLPHVVGKLLQAQPEGQNRIATAESCTGGLLAKMLTDVPGSSEYFDRGWVTYDPSAKAEVLGVGFSIIREHGLVSEPVAVAMANGARQHADAAYGIGITGVAGPGGGTEKTPVGTVCIALTGRDDSTARTFNFPGDREMIRDRAAKMALTMLRFKLLGRKLPF